MQLLVSVRSVVEVVQALAGGADIIDAKEPSRGSLGAVAPETLAAILAEVPPDCPCSAALGDLATGEAVVEAIRPLRLQRRAPVFLKLGFAGLQSEAGVGRLIEEAVRAAANHPARPRVVAVAYADAARACTPPPEAMLRLAQEAGAHGVLLDTHVKDGRGLLRVFSVDALGEWVSEARRRRLLSALAGEIRPADLRAIERLGPDVVGVRGSACEGGRGGIVTAWRVRALRSALEQGEFGLSPRGASG